MSEISGNIYDRSIAIVLEIVKTYFYEKCFKILCLCFIFIQKAAELVLKKLP